MSQKLLITFRLLLTDFLTSPSAKRYFFTPKGIMKKALLLMLFSLISLTGYGQLATETFQNGIPATWAQARVKGTVQWAIDTDGYQSNKAAFLDPTNDDIGAGNSAQYFLITPLITVPANGEIRFFTKQSYDDDYGNTYQIRLSTASQPDVSGFTTTLTSWTEKQLNPNTPVGYVEKVVAIPPGITPGINIYVAFVLVTNQVEDYPVADTWFIDNVSLQTAPACSPLLGGSFVTSAVTSNSATLGWSQPAATNFEVQVVAAGAAPGTTGTATTTNSYNVTGLTPDTSYDAYVKTICSPTVSSTWAGPFTFKTRVVGTSCTDPITVPGLASTPYTISTNLNLYANPDVVYTTQGSGCLNADGYSNYLNGAKAFFNYTPTADGLITISLTALSGGTCYNAYSNVLVYDGCANVGINCLGGANTTSANVAKRISNLQVQAGHTYVIVVSSILDASAGICFTMTIDGSACAAPSVYTYTNLQQTGVSFSWNNVGNYASAWQYAVRPANAGVPTGAGIATTTSTNNVISGLTAGTSYDLYVRSVCNGTPGNWGEPYRFTTQCAAYSTPYSTAFDNATSTVPEVCWSAIDVNDDGSAWTYIASYDKPGAYATLRTNTSQANNNDILVSPQVNLTGTQKRLRYKYQSLYGTSNYAVKLSTTGIGINNFTYILKADSQAASMDDGWEEVIINIPTTITGPVNIAWVVSPTADETSSRLSIDEVFIEDKPACSDPIKPTVVSVAATSANLTWTAGDAETQWQVVVQAAGTGVPTTNTGVIVSGNTYTAPGLNSATQYEYYVRAYCSATQQSNWVGPVAFVTLCSVFEVPFKETFNPGDIATSHKSCWSVLDANEDGVQWQITATANSATIQGNRFFPTASYDDWLISPAINVQGTKALKFKYKAAFSIAYPTSRYGLEVLISTTDTNPESFSVIMPFMEFTNRDYIEKSVYINASGPVYIAFRVPPAFVTAGGSSILNIDDVIIEDAPACPNPYGLVVGNITKNSAKLTWSKGFQETQWEAKVQPAGAGAPTGNGAIVTDTNHTDTTLSPNTSYDYYVRAVCSGTSKSEWVGPIRFTTLCESFVAPFTETFNTNSTSENCWRILNSNNDTNAWNLNVTVKPYEGNQMAGMFTGSNGANDDWLISPTVTIKAGQRLRYYYKVYSSDFTEDLEVKLSTTGVEPASFTTMLYTTDADTTPLNNVEIKEKIINFPTGVTGDINVAFHIPQKEPSDMGYRGQLLFIDYFVIEDVPACAEPSNLTVQNIADTTADLKWDANGTETSWEISVQPAGTPAPVGATNPDYLHTSTTNPYGVTGLVPATKYEYYVRAICSTTQQSAWVGPFEFTTRCSLENLCEYTITLTNDTTFGVGGSIDLIQNGNTIQQMEFYSGAWNATPEPIDYTVFLCTGVEFSLFWNSIGSAPDQYPGAQVTVKNSEGEIVYTSELGLGTPKRTLYTGVALCGDIACPQPKNLTVSNTSVMSWTAGGSETQWEVAIQPVGNNTIPQSGKVVSTPSYTPVASDFNSATAATFEYFVRAICNTNNTSYWSGPHIFVRNDDASTALVVPVNETENCNVSATEVSFINSTVSADAATGCTVDNKGDVWFEFTATSKVHIIEVSGFTGNFYYSSGEEPFPNITTTLYKVNGSALEQMTCSVDNSITAMNSTELVVGDTYKVRLTLNGTEQTSRKFAVCITTPPDLCKVNAVNYGFEEPPMQNVTGVTTFTTQYVVPGWRVNLSTWDAIFFSEALNAINFAPYSGGQCIQLLSDPEEDYDAANPKGIFKEFDTSETTKMNYSFASSARSAGVSVQLYAGAPQGPFTMIREEQVNTDLSWKLNTGSYVVPQGQAVTRFIFVTKDNQIGALLDEANFIADNTIITQPLSLACPNNVATVEANGVGTWVADDSNPSTTVIATPNVSKTTIAGFTQTGTYIFHWITRYCDNTIVITNKANEPVTGFTYAATYCSDATTDQPQLTDGFTTGGVFTSTEGLSINASTGEINVAGSTPGNYTVTYTVAPDAATCNSGGTNVATLIILEKIDAVVTEDCKNQQLWLHAAAKDDEHNENVTYTWKSESGATLATNTADFNVSQYYANNPNLKLPIVIKVITGSGECTSEVNYTVNNILCSIPRGISPNGDGDNDSFDLSTMGVKEITIFNRYGLELYHFKGAYTNQWHGQGKGNDDLPDGTYFYSIHKTEGSAVTGWVYINREHN